MSWTAAPAAKSLLEQATRAWPSRDKSSDGLIGDASHSSRVSDHNPDADGIVLAVDLTDDPAHGCDCRAIFEAIVATRDARVKYAIHERLIVSSQTSPWVVRHYDGTNPHTGHMHVSILKSRMNDTSPWPGIPSVALPDGCMYRLISRTRGHFLTADKAEAVRAMGQGFTYEGAAWAIDPACKAPVERFRRKDGSYLYTADLAEIVKLVTYYGWLWVREGVAFYAGGTRPVYRYRNVLTGRYFFTLGEKPAWPWRLEGEAFKV